MFPGYEQKIGPLALFVAAVAVSHAIPVVSKSASGNHSSCAEIATAYEEWSTNGGKCLVGRNNQVSQT